MMSEKPHQILLQSEVRARFVEGLREFAHSPDGPRAKLFLGLLLVLLVGINALNVKSSYIGRDFMTAVASRDAADFSIQTIRYVFILLACTSAAVIYRYCEERLGLLWRKSLTQRLINQYLQRRLYYRLNHDHRVLNPDQRIADDVKLFTQTTLSFLLMGLNATMSVIAFSGVMWSISPLLFGVAVSYASAGSLATLWFGRPLVRINYNQFDREAELRADLVRLRENSEFIALAHNESHFHERLANRLDRLVTNYRRLINVNRNLNFFTTGYNYFIQVIPVLVVAPMYMRGQVEFGVITQSSVAFAQLLGAFSLIITQFQQISSYAAVVSRLADFSSAAREHETAPPRSIEVVEENDDLDFQNVTLEAPEDHRVLVEDLTLTVQRGMRMLVTSPGEMAKLAFFRAMADLWDNGRGRIARPLRQSICFLPQRPYLPPGTMREVLASPDCAKPPTDERIRQTLQGLELEESVARIGGLDVERDWDDIFSLGELQRFAIARVLLIAPDFVVLDRIETTLEAERMHGVLGMFDGAGITYVTIGRGDSDLPHYDMVLELSGNGPWTLRSARPAQALQEAPAGAS